ncbi:MAG: cell wall-active antibiotics response protein [Actinomycetota bacterium]|nr:cell wall-active antibiotics response protein [Actinomycetota bacterium]
MAVFGDVKVIVPEDAAVELTGTALFGDNRSEVTGASPTATPCESRDWPWSAT